MEIIKYDMYRIIGDNIRECIRGKIKGYSKVYPNGRRDCIEVVIQNGDFVFEDYLTDVAFKAINGYDFTQDYVEKDLIPRIKQCIYKKYFN